MCPESGPTPRGPLSPSVWPPPSFFWGSGWGSSSNCGVMRDSVWSSEKSNKAGYHRIHRESKFYTKYCFIVRIQCLCLFSGLQNILSNLWTEGKALHFTNWLSATSISAVCSSVSTVLYIYIFIYIYKLYYILYYIYILDQKSIWHHLWPLACLPCFCWLHSKFWSLAKQKPSLPLLWTPSSENIEKLRGGTLEGKPQQFEWPKYDRSEPTTLWCLQLSWHCGAVVSLKLSNQPWNIVKL